MTNQKQNLIGFIAEVRSVVAKHCSSELNVFDIYANEALFCHSLIEDDIRQLSSESRVLEVGAGIMLLSGYLAREGIRIWALEPVSAEFTHYRGLQHTIRQYYKEIGLSLEIIDLPIEDFCDRKRFDYIFSINVFEHIVNVDAGLENSYASLRQNGIFRVYCPNYHFPYEPHFNIPTLISKKWTQTVFWRTISSSNVIHEPEKTWKALNWITVTQVRRHFRQYSDASLVFCKGSTYHILLRTIYDARFRDRRSWWVISGIRFINCIGLLHVVKILPAALLPVMDFKVRRMTGLFIDELHD